MARKQTSEADVVKSGTSGVSSVRRKNTAANRKKHSAPQTINAEPVAEATSVVAMVYEPTADEIALQAFLYWEARGCQGGSPEEDWIRAEQELRSRK
jgi:hypothetical protein